MAAADRAACEAELYIDLLAVPGKASAVLHDPDQPPTGDGGPEGSTGRRISGASDISSSGGTGSLCTI